MTGGQGRYTLGVQPLRGGAAERAAAADVAAPRTRSRLISPSRRLLKAGGARRSRARAVARAAGRPAGSSARARRSRRSRGTRASARGRGRRRSVRRSSLPRCAPRGFELNSTPPGFERRVQLAQHARQLGRGHVEQRRHSRTRRRSAPAAGPAPRKSWCQTSQPVSARAISTKRSAPSSPIARWPRRVKVLQVASRAAAQVEQRYTARGRRRGAAARRRSG